MKHQRKPSLSFIMATTACHGFIHINQNGTLMNFLKPIHSSRKYKEIKLLINSDTGNCNMYLHGGNGVNFHIDRDDLFTNNADNFRKQLTTLID